MLLREIDIASVINFDDLIIIVLNEGLLGCKMH
jgi:hypothetical protein